MLAWLALASPSALAEAAEPPVLAAKEVFQGPEFWWKRVEPQETSSSWLWSFLEAVWEPVRWVLSQIFDLLGWLLKKIFGAFSALAGGAGGDSLIVWLIALAVLAWVAWKVYPSFVRWLGASSLPSRPTGSPDASSLQTLAEASDLFSQAEQAHRDGDHAEAVRLALLALIARLERQGLLRYDTTRTNREYQRELRHRADLASLFATVSRIYERIWYGRISASESDAEEALRHSRLVIVGKELAPE
jgi:hypothetical protein